jgi:hypothetical protein
MSNSTEVSTEVKYFLVTLTRQSSGYENSKKKLVKAYDESLAGVQALEGETHDTPDYDETGCGYDSEGDYWVNEHTIATIDSVKEITDFDEIQVLEKYL